MVPESTIMRLKIVGDGTQSGTVIVNADNNCELDKVEGFEWYLTPGNGNSWVRLKISSVFFHIDPSITFTPGQVTPQPSATQFNLKVVGDGTEAGTYIVDAATNDVLENISYQQWGYDDDVACVVLNIEVSNVLMMINPNSPMTSSQIVQVGSASSFPVTISASPSAAYNPTNPYYPFNSFGGGGSGGSGQSQQDPLLPGMPPDLLSVNTSNCAHDWVNVGFSSLKYVCRKCNAERNS